MREVVTYLTRALVDAPEQVTVDELPSGRATVYEVRAAPDDVGKLIGRGGRTIKAVRRLVAAVAGGRRIEIEVRADDE